MNLIQVQMEAIRFAFLVIWVVILGVEGQLGSGFYSSSCPRAEDIVRSTVEEHFDRGPTIAAGLLRLHFHDCFVQVDRFLHLLIFYIYIWFLIN